MSDRVSRLLTAIEEAERLARATISTVNPTTGEWAPAGEYGTEIRDSRDHLVVKHSWPDEIAHIAHNDPAAVLRRCEADREEVELHAIVWRDIGWLEWDESEYAEMYAELPVCGLCVPKHSSFPTRQDVPEGPCRTIRLRARAYGISVEGETTGE